MSTARHIIMVLALLAGAAVSAGADETKTESEVAKTPELKKQTHCPVMGGKIDSTIFTDIQGQRVYHCCPACSAKLKADPDKYFKKAAAEGVMFENIQTTCPVSGEELENKSVFIDYEGRRVAFCCEKCRATFSKDPGMYLKKLDEKPAAKDEPMEMETEDVNEHGH